jgi:hypothetical protein
MNDKDKWSAHLEFCKLVITLATALLTATAIIYADSSKLPRGASRYILLFCDLSLLSTLVCSVMASIALSNLLVNSDDTYALRRKKRATRVTVFSTLAFYSLVLSGLLLFIFFACKVYWPKGH